MKSLKFFPLVCLLGFLLLLSCDRDAATAASDGSWTASFRVASSLTDSQLSRATWVRVQASRSGVVLVSDSAPYTAHSVTLTIPSAGAVDISLTGLNSGKDTVMWAGTGTIADGVTNPGNVVSLVAGPGLQSSTTGTVSAPTFSVSGGTYTSAQTVRLSSATSGASIYYTMDGTTPTISSPLYTGALTVSASETVKAIAVKSGWTSSSVTSAAYVISSATQTKTQFTLTVTQPTGGTITLNKTGSTFDSGTTVIATATAGTGYTFSAWTGASASAVSVCTLTVTQNLSLSATFTVSSTSSTGDTGHFTDSRDGQSYKYVKIGTQTWMAQNLNYQVDSSWCPSGVASNCATYGRLYQWAAAMDLASSYNSSTWGGTLPHQGICPSGWHIPSDAEWSTLVQYVDSATSGTKLKSTSGWYNSGDGTNAYGFNVLPAGGRSTDGTFDFLGLYATFWSSSEYAASLAWYRHFYYGGAYVSRGNYDGSYGFSLRCLRN